MRNAVKTRTKIAIATIVLSGHLLTCHAAETNAETNAISTNQSSAELWRIHRADFSDWRKVLESPEATNDSYYGEFARKLEQSQVPTEQEAIVRAMRVSGAVDMRVTWRVSALLRLADPDEELGKTGDFVWEVRVLKMTDNEGIEGLIWVSTTTGKTKVLFSPPDKR